MGQQAPATLSTFEPGNDRLFGPDDLEGSHVLYQGAQLFFVVWLLRDSKYSIGFDLVSAALSLVIEFSQPFFCFLELLFPHRNDTEPKPLATFLSLRTFHTLLSTQQPKRIISSHNLERIAGGCRFVGIDGTRLSAWRHSLSQQ